MLDEAIAKYQATVGKMHCFDPKECQLCEEDKALLDAAVRDVALAAAREARDTGLPHTQAEIDRQFGLPEGSERGKE